MPRYSSFGSALTILNGSTAIVLACAVVAGSVESRLERDSVAPREKNRNMAAITEQSATAVTAAIWRLRFAQRQARTGGETRRATIGLPSNQRSRSTAKSTAERYRAWGSRSRQRAQIVSKSRSKVGARERSFGAGSSMAC